MNKSLNKPRNTETFEQETVAFGQMKTKLGTDGMTLLEEQLEILTELNDRQLKSPLRDSLKSGDITLPKGTLLHGIRSIFDIDAVKGVSEKGIVSGELVGISEDSETHGCADFFRTTEEMTIGQYFTWAKETISSPLGNVKMPRGERLLAGGVVFIVDAQAEGMNELLKNDAYLNSNMAGFVNLPGRRTAEDTAAILGGVPLGAIAGIVVGERLLSRNPETLSILSQYFPDLPIFDHKGNQQSLEESEPAL